MNTTHTESDSKLRDDGFSLVELSVAMVVLGIIALVASTFVVGLFRSEQAVQGISSSSNDSQIITMALTDDLRNARSFTTTPTAVIASVSTADADVAWECVRWEVDPALGELTRSQWVDPGSANHAIPSGAANATSVVLARGVASVEAEPFFSGGGSSTASGSTTGTLEYQFNLATSGEHSIEVSGQITNRVASAGTSCWAGE